jgi:gliding motility-associated lipoprotein GldH
MLLKTRKKNLYTVSFLCLASVVFAFFSCQTVDLYERIVSIPNQEWKSSYKPQFSFVIKDTQSRYDVYVLVRHNEKYEFNNIWISFTYQLKGHAPISNQYELPLANNEGWLGTAMDDLYDHRIRITPSEGIALKAGEYSFTLGQIMRKDPLENVLNIGLRIEKKP